MNEITGVWMNRDHTRLMIERDRLRAVFVIDINDESSGGAPDVQVLSINDATSGDTWDEMYPETDFS